MAVNGPPCEKEVWRPIAKLDGLYEVSSYGRVRRAAPGKGTYVGKILRQGSSTAGYCIVLPSVNGVVRAMQVHRLVAEAFIPNPLEKTQVNHKDGDKTNNRVENLEWVTVSENILHSYRVLGNRHPKQERRHVKLTDEEIQEIRSFDGNYAETGRAFGISDVMARKIKLGIAWKE